MKKFRVTYEVDIVAATPEEAAQLAYAQVLRRQNDAFDVTDDVDCDCADRGWYGEEHDTACFHAEISR